MTVFRPVHRGVLLLGLRIAHETLRFGSVVFLAPITLPLEFGSYLGVAHTTLRFRNTMFIAPPAAVVVAIFAVIMTIARKMFTISFSRGRATIRDVSRPTATGTPQNHGQRKRDRVNTIQD
jgi:hypothetical protein